MAAVSRHPQPGVIDRLQSVPWEFDFLAVVEWLEQCALRESGKPVNWDSPPVRQPVRFRAWQSSTFPASDIVAARVIDSDAQRQVELTVGFMGLTGPNGVLPRHYLRMLLDQMREAARGGLTEADRRSSLQDFFDLLNHRQIVLFYRAWQKYRQRTVFPGTVLPGTGITADGSRPAIPRRENLESTPTRALFALTGLATGEWTTRPGSQAQRGRFRFPDEVLLYFSGLFAHFPRSAQGIEQAAGKLFGVPLKIEQFRLQWIQLRPGDQSRLPRASETPRNAALGVDVILGARAPSYDTRFRVCLGPLTWRQFVRFLPAGDLLRPLAQFVRMYVGAELDFDVQPVLKAREIPPTRLGTRHPDPARLGWNTWVWSRPPQKDAGDAVFVEAGLGNPDV
jgi:type VI secretion system protein ImpH